METKENGKQLKKLAITDKSFEANGKTYFIEPEISAERFQKMQELEIELGYGSSYKKLYEGLGQVYSLLNQNKFADSAVHVHNLMNSLATLEERRSPIMEYCACFINTESEDRRKFDEKVVADKIADWEEEGIDYFSFFNLAVNMVSGLKENYLKFIQDTSE